MNKKSNDQTRKAKTTRNFFKYIDKAGIFVRKWGPITGAAIIAIVGAGKIKPKGGKE